MCFQGIICPSPFQIGNNVFQPLQQVLVGFQKTIQGRFLVGCKLDFFFHKKGIFFQIEVLLQLIHEIPQVKEKFHLPVVKLGIL